MSPKFIVVTQAPGVRRCIAVDRIAEVWANEGLKTCMLELRDHEDVVLLEDPFARVAALLQGVGL